MPERWCGAPAALVALAVTFSGCRGRSAVLACEWPLSTSSSITLLDDIRLAEEIAIRHADSRGYREGWRASREACESILFDAVASSRHLSIGDVRRARAQLEHRGFDWAVNAPMAVVTCVVAWVIGGRIRRRFKMEAVPLLIAAALSSIGLAVAVVAIGQVWASAVEVMRIGNGHLSYRAFRIPWSQHRLATFAIVVLAAWSIMLIQHLGTRTGHPSTHP